MPWLWMPVWPRTGGAVLTVKTGQGWRGAGRMWFVSVSAPLLPAAVESARVTAKHGPRIWRRVAAAAVAPLLLC